MSGCDRWEELAATDLPNELTGSLDAELVSGRVLNLLHHTPLDP